MTKDFDLEAILTFVTGITLVDDFKKAFELVWFVFNDNFINDFGLGVVSEELKKHLLTIHPELMEVRLPMNDISLEEWIIQEKAKYGEKLAICRINETLENKVAIR